MLDEAYKHYETTVRKLHSQVDQNNYQDMGNINTAFNLLDSEIRNIKKTATWPWQPETLRWLLTAIILPLLMWIVQQYLVRLFN